MTKKISADLLLIRGLVAEAGVEPEFNRNLELLRDLLKRSEQQGTKEHGAFLLAVGYFAAEEGSKQ